MAAALAIALGWLGVIAAPGRAAERLYATYGPLGMSLAIESLENFAETGELDTAMRFYARFFDGDRLGRLRNLLRDHVEVSPLALSRFLSSPQGEILVRQLARSIRTRSGAGSLPALRAALVLAAASPEGLTLLNALKFYPTPTIQLDLNGTVGIFREIEAAVVDQALALDAIIAAAIAEQQAEQTTDPTPPQPLPPLTILGPNAWRTRTLSVYAPHRRAPIFADLYWPAEATGRVPVVLISHGLGSERATFAYLARHLASHGFAVVLPEHPGSNQTRLSDLLDGRANEVADPLEFVHRPRDLSVLLDELAASGIPDRTFRGQLDLGRVGVIGQSFGGYTALAIAGATLNFGQLERDCRPDTLPPNPSLLLQCRALVARNIPSLPTVPPQLQNQTLPPPQGSSPDRLSLRDERVAITIAVNPITSSVFGTSGLNDLAVPSAIIASSEDAIAPMLPEQIQPFARLDRPDKYLLVALGSTHLSFLGSTGNETLQLPASLLGTRPDLARTYLSAYSLALLRRYLNDDPSAIAYLTSTAIARLARPELPLYGLRRLSAIDLPKPQQPTR
ncbi:MAG: alpha/beta hydrolase [Cyanophyceae cyanobacterium]